MDECKEVCSDVGSKHTIVKRNNTIQPIDVAKIRARIQAVVRKELPRSTSVTFYGDAEPTVIPMYHKASRVPPRLLNIPNIAASMLRMLPRNITADEFDNLLAEHLVSLVTKGHVFFANLSARISVSQLYKSTSNRFSECIHALYHYVNPETGRAAPLINDDVYKAVQMYTERLDTVVAEGHTMDLLFDAFGFNTLHRSYLLKINGKVWERPQYLYMRVALGHHPTDIDAAIRMYRLLSAHIMTQATPSMFNSGTPHPQLSSCFLLDIKDDSISGIYDTLKDCALISKTAGGIGLAVHKIRASGTYIAGTNGTSNGLVPMLRVFNNTARYVDQGGGRRKGSFAMYLEPWHPDLPKFLNLRKNSGADEIRARDLFYALWVPDLFFERVQANKHWTYMCPHKYPGLPDVWGAEFEALYTKYEDGMTEEETMRNRVNARDVWASILTTQVETGMPYLLSKDACNRCSNQQHLGTIKSSNLCTEIVQYTSPKETAVCNLASIALPRFLTHNTAGRDDWPLPTCEGLPASKFLFDFDLLARVVAEEVRNLNIVIDKNEYPVEEARFSNMSHRPIGLGVQGLADVFYALCLPYDSDAAKRMNARIFEVIYLSAVRTSIELAKDRLDEIVASDVSSPSNSGAYKSYAGSPASKNILQFDMWGVTPTMTAEWAEVKENLAVYGMRNSLLIALMPTASTAQIMGNTEGVEPVTSNMYSRRVLAGTYVVVNPYMVKALDSAGFWTPEIINSILVNRGSVQHLIGVIPSWICRLFKTVWEISQRHVIEHAAGRSPYVCQSQSMNLYLSSPSVASLSSMYMAGWKAKLKTLVYYLRTHPKLIPMEFSLDKDGEEARLTRAETDTDAVGDKTDDADVAVDIESITIPGIDGDDMCMSCGS